jgi:hypothetical protein
VIDILTECVADCLKLLPFLYLSYLLVEYAEHRMSSQTRELIYRAGKAGPLIGAVVGIIPQCGFSAAAAGLFAGGMVSPGTLVAVFLSTSDEMLPILLSEHIAGSVIFRILAVKVIAAAVIGLATDFAAECIFGRRKHMPEHPEMCEHEHCGCEKKSIWYSALSHTVQTAVFIFLISLALSLCMEVFGLSAGTTLFDGVPGLQEALAALVGMIPNCAASVLITELYLDGVIRSGALFSGLLCGAGTGLLVLCRENRSRRMNLALIAILYVGGLSAGLVAGALGVL